MITSNSFATFERATRNVFITPVLILTSAISNRLEKTRLQAALSRENDSPNIVVPQDYAIEACQLLTAAWAGLY